MNFEAKRQLVVQVAARYREARHAQKSVILDEFVAATGYARKYAIRLLMNPALPPPAAITRSRPRHYGPEVQEALVVAWRAANGICSKRLIPFLPELIPVLERHGHLVVTGEARVQLLALSPATADRILQPFRQRDGIRGISTTKPGALLKRQIPIRTFADWDDARPGFLEADLVAHCGHSTEGAFLHTLTLADVKKDVPPHECRTYGSRPRTTGRVARRHPTATTTHPSEEGAVARSLARARLTHRCGLPSCAR